jgi:hypothetical protein
VQVHRYEWALTAQSRHVSTGGLCAQLLLVPFYTGCPRMCQTLFDPAYAPCLRAMEFTNEEEVSLFSYNGVMTPVVLGTADRKCSWLRARVILAALSHICEF